MRLFFDTSALLKRYVAEPGTQVVNAELARASQLVVASITIVEAISALNRKQKAKELDAADLEGIRHDLLADLADAIWVAVSGSIIESAARLVETCDLRTLDSLQLACALASAPDLFVCADKTLVTAAMACGLATLDPLDPPIDTVPI